MDNRDLQKLLCLGFEHIVHERHGKLIEAELKCEDAVRLNRQIDRMIAAKEQGIDDDPALQDDNIPQFL